MQIYIDNFLINVEIVRKKSNKNLYFRFTDRNTLTVSTPYLVTKKEILNLIDKNINSLKKMYYKVLKLEEADEYFLFLGKRFVTVYDNSLNDVFFDSGFVYAKDEKSLNKYVTNYTKVYFEEEVNRILNDFINIPPFKLKIRKMKTRWGVCNRSLNIITLNSELIKRTKEELDYVIINELCHFYEANHSKNFWNHVEKHCYNYKTIRKKMKEAVS